MAERTIEYVRLDALRPADVNPKEHDEPGIAASFGRFGYIEPIVMDERTEKLLSGHGRLAVLRAQHEAGAELPDGIEVDAEDGMWLAPVVRGWASEDDDEAAGALLAVNELVRRGGWHAEELGALLSRQDDLTGTGYVKEDLAALLAPAEERQGQGVESSRSERLARYTEKESRSIVLDYDADTFERVTGLLERARKRMHLASNADVFAALLEPTP